MNAEQARALTSLSIFAAFADGAQSDAERERIKAVVQGLGNAGATDAFQRVMLKETTPAAEAALLDTEELRQLAWVSALGVCESDGATSPAERQFLDELAIALQRPLDAARRDIEQADSMARGATSPELLPVMRSKAASGPAGSQFDAHAAEVDEMVLRYAVLTASIDLLPQNFATLAIIPLQTKMVYGIGHTYGYSLSAASIKEFAATVGIGMTGQVVEQYARKFMRAIGGGVLGGIGRFAAGWGTGPVLTFATTYAIGIAARQYYASGRTLSAVDLRAIFTQQAELAKGLYQRFEPQVQQTAATTDAVQLLQSLRS